MGKKYFRNIILILSGSLLSTSSFATSTKNVRKPRKEKQFWTNEENQKLETSVQKYHNQRQHINWIKIAKNFPNRTSRQCCEHWNRCLKYKVNQEPLAEEDANHNPRVRRRNPFWTSKEDQKLKAMVQRYLEQGQPIDWKEITNNFPSHTYRQCRYRWQNYLKSNSVKINAISPKEMNAECSFKATGKSMEQCHTSKDIWTQAIPFFKDKSRNFY